MKNSLIEKLFSVKDPTTNNAINTVVGKNEVRKMIFQYFTEGSISESLVEMILGMKITKKIPMINGFIPEEILRIEELSAKNFFNLVGENKVFFSPVKNTGFYEVYYTYQNDIKNDDGELVLCTNKVANNTKISSKAKFEKTKVESAVYFEKDTMYICLAGELALHYLPSEVLSYNETEKIIYDNNLSLVSS
jgi:hypothetical protein